MKLEKLRLKAVLSITGMVLAVVVFAGCTVTKAKLTGTQGATVTGYYWFTTHTNTVDVNGPQGKLPTDWFEASLGLFRHDQLQECSFRKTDTNTSLLLTLKTHGFNGSVAAPPGTSGVRVVRDGKHYVAETF